MPVHIEKSGDLVGCYHSGTNKRPTEKGKIELLSQWTKDGWDEQYSPLFQLTTYQWNCVFWISGLLLWNLRRASWKDIFQSNERYVKIFRMSTSKFCFANSVILRKSVTSISNVSSSLFLPHYHCSFELVKVKEVTTCTFSKALVNEKAVGIQILYLVQPIALERIRKVLRREYRVMIFGKKCWFILRAVDAQLFRETIAHRPNIIEMFLDGDVLIEILCKCQIYSETIADRKNIIETFLGGDILIGY